VLPSTTAEVARVLAWCYDHDIPVVPRGGGTGFAGGAVPLDGGVVLALERLARVRAFEPLLWRMWVEAGVTTARVRRLALEYLDAATLAAAGRSLPVDPPGGARFLVLAEVDGSAEEVERLRAELVAVLAEGAVAVHAPSEAATIAELWRWREGVSIAVTAELGGKVTEDIVVPLDRLGEASEETLAIGERHGLPACSWGHAGDGNLHSTFLVAADDEHGLARAPDAPGRSSS
jgi:FAD/FMN-containing dehydrogenase